MADPALIRAVKAVRYAPQVANWTSISRAEWRGEEVTRLKLRRGLVLDAIPASRLLGLYKEIWFRDAYGLHADPLPPGATVIDIGANIGVFAVYAAVESGAARVLSYEPFPDSFALLKRNAEQNHLSAIEPRPLGVAGRRGTRRLYVGACHGWNKLYSQEDLPAVEIQCVTLADVFEQERVTRCHFLKVDCEGAEYEILLEAPPELLRRVDRAVVEYHNHLTEHSHTELEEVLRRAGLQVRAEGGPVTGYIVARRGE
jgi:FkbM family methyltransferase